MGHFFTIMRSVAYRDVRRALARPALLLPGLLGPLVFFATNAGGFSGISNAPGFNFPGGYTTFQFVFIVMQSAIFNGVFMGFTIAADFETGFIRRFLLAARARTGIIAGYCLAALVRVAAGLVVLFIASLIVGVNFNGGFVEILGLLALVIFPALAGTLWGCGVAMRLRTVQAAPAMQVPIFLSLFLAPVFVPRALLESWIKTIARFNPVTFLLETGRGFISGTQADAFLAFGVSFGLVIVLTAWAVRGLRSAERAG